MNEVGARGAQVGNISSSIEDSFTGDVSVGAAGDTMTPPSSSPHPIQGGCLDN
jgi:hypothetical protein